MSYNKINKAAKKYERAKKRKISQAVQRETPLRSRFPFSLLVCVTACACLGEAQPSPLVIDKHTPWCQIENKLAPVTFWYVTDTVFKCTDKLTNG